MPSPQAQTLIATFRKELKESGIFTRSLDVARQVWDEFSESVPAYTPEVRIDEVDQDGVRGEWVTHPAS